MRNVFKYIVFKYVVFNMQYLMYSIQIQIYYYNITKNNFIK